MNGHALSKHSLSYEESINLLDEKNLSDVDSDAGKADNETRFSTTAAAWANTARSTLSSLPMPRRPPPMSACLALLRRAGFFLLPSFVQSRLSHDRKHGADKPGPTAYLDGMRGMAAFSVFLCHYLYTCFIIAEGWGFEEHNYNFFKLPFVRLLYAGPPQVAIFFVVSGYALSLKPIKLARQQKWDNFATTMASFVFRRALRLFLPTAISTFMIVMLLQLGAYEWTREFSRDSTFMKNVQETAPDLKDSLSEQLSDWGRNMFNFVHIWGWEPYGGSTYYDVHLWTIPVEFRASMMLFLSMIGLCRLRTWLRFAFVSLLAWFSYRNDRWEMVLFYSGMLLAELDTIRGAHCDPLTNAAVAASNPSHHQLPMTEPRPLDLVGRGRAPSRVSSLKLKTAAWMLLSAGALYLMSQPDVHGAKTPGWVYLSSLIPEWVSEKYRYWQCVGSILFVLCVGYLPAWQRVFMTPPIQYLGRISYAIYLMHGPVIHTIGYATERWAWGVTGIEGWRYNAGFTLASVFVVPSVIWAADLFWRSVDAPVVRFAKWFENSCIVSDKGQDGQGHGRS
jgi:peptidoglycan/LPS O-acetylase OafA/YrhL